MNVKMKRVLVTGANGFIGRHLSQVLHGQGAMVVGFVRNSGAQTPYLAEQHVVDISDRFRLRQLVQDTQPDLVVHLAADKNRGIDLAEYRSGYEANLFGTLNLIEACQELAAIARFVFLGSCEEYGQQSAPFDESSKELPVSAYAVTKLAVTQLLQTLARANNFPAVVLRPSIIYGPGQSEDMFLPALIKTLLSGERFGMTRGEQTRDLLYIDDLVDAILLALVAPDVPGQVINISSAVPVRIEDLARKTARMIGLETESLLDFGARDYRLGEAMNYWAKNSLAKALLDWMPHVILEDGLRQTVDHFQAAVSVNPWRN